MLLLFSVISSPGGTAQQQQQMKVSLNILQTKYKCCQLLLKAKLMESVDGSL